MMLDKLKKIIAPGESNTLEFKISTSQLKAAIETLCAYLNSEGGQVLLGVKDNGSIVGQHCTDNTQQEIARELAKIEPRAHIKVDYIEIDGDKKVISFKTPKGKHAPYIYDGRPYYRNLSTTARMPQHMYEQLLVERGQLDYNWEEVIVKECTINDLDTNEIYKTVSDGVKEGRVPASAIKEEPEEILSRFKLLKNEKLKRAALVLFARDDQIELRQCMVKLARFKGTDNLGDFLDNQQVYGNAFKLLNEIDLFLSRHLPIASHFKKDQFKRIDKPILPVMAVREAVINALVHRDYSNSGTAIMVAIYDDRLEIWNYGALPENINISDLKGKHRSILRNKLIGSVFYARGMIETWGTGTNKIIDLCREDGIPEPVFEQLTGGVSITFKFKDPIGTIPVFTNIQISYDELTEQQKLIMQLLRKHGKLSPKELIGLIGYKISDKSLRKELNKLQDLRLVYSEGETKSRRWGSLM